ncbi:MAG: hypothetical protein ACTS7I_01640 [Candidatus Hodgkinia cicadicola]
MPRLRQLNFSQTWEESAVMDLELLRPKDCVPNVKRWRLTQSEVQAPEVADNLPRTAEANGTFQVNMT